MTPSPPCNPLCAPRARVPVISRAVVEALHDLFEAIALAINEFNDPIDRAALRDAAQLLADVAIKYDEAGGYRIFCQTADEVTV